MSSPRQSFRSLGFANRRLEPMSPRNQPGQQAAALPAVRKLDFRHDADGKVSLKHLNKDSRNTAAWVQTRGTVATTACARCLRGCGPFETCVVLEIDGVRPIGATCANCHFNGEGHVCSFRSVPAEISDDEVDTSRFAVTASTPTRRSTRVSQLRAQARAGQGRMITGNKQKRSEDPFVSSEPAGASPAVTFGYPAGREVIQARRPGQRPGVEHGARGRTALVGNVLSMKVTEAQADDVEFLSGALDDLANFAMVLQRRRAKAEGPVVSKWDEAVQEEPVEEEQMEMSGAVQAADPEESSASEQPASEEEFQGFLSSSSSHRGLAARSDEEETPSDEAVTVPMPVDTETSEEEEDEEEEEEQRPAKKARKTRTRRLFRGTRPRRQ